MTVKFDEQARKRMIDRYNENDFTYNGEPVRNIVVKPISKSLAREYIASFHYTKTMPDSTRFAFAGYLNNKVCGVICYGMGAGKNQYTSLIPNIENGQYIELTRLWCANDYPRNTESRIISESLKLLPENIKLVVSFADESESHCGIIYQATNWIYCGKTNGGKMLLCENGIKKHPRLLGIYKLRHPEYKSLSNDELMRLLGYSYTEAGCKFRYIFAR